MPFSTLSQDPTLALLIAGIILFALLVVVFTIATIYIRLRNLNRQKRYERLEKTWLPVLLDVLEGERAPRYLMYQVKRRDRVFFLRFLLVYSERMRGAEVNQALYALARPFFPWVWKRLRSGWPERRAEALRMIATFALHEHGWQIVPYLRDPSPLVAMTAARSLVHEGEPEMIVPVLEQIDRFTNWNASYLASLLASADREAIPHIRDLLADGNRSQTARACAADALREVSDSAGADIAAHTLESPQGRELTAACLRLLRKVGRSEHAPVVRKLLAHPDDVIRANAMSAIGVLGREEDTASMVDGLTHPSVWVSIHAARGLVRAGRMEPLRDLARSEHQHATIARQILDEVENS